MNNTDDFDNEVPLGPNTPVIPEWVEPLEAPPLAPPPLLCRQMTADKFAYGHEILDWVHSLEDQLIAGERASTLEVFPVCIWYGFGSETTEPKSVHYVVFTDEDHEGYDERYDSTNPRHLQLVALNEWWHTTGREIYFADVATTLSFTE
jgi:hypothetical protein